MTTTKITLLLPTRGRSNALDRSVTSLLDTADHPESIQWLFAFDEDDSESYQYFKDTTLGKIKDSGGVYSCMEFPPLGYGRLHEYLNTLAKFGTGDWFVFWNDDAVMLDKGWDSVIASHTGTFCVQAFDTHNMHPYSIFPIIPKEWYTLLGHLSQHSLNDAWISQIAWMLDIMVRIPIKVEHERFDLTGKNQDSTYQNRQVFEGNINDPRDFNHLLNRKKRITEANVLSKYLESKGIDQSRWHKIQAGKKDPWDKMLASDVNNMMMRVDPFTGRR